MIKRHIFFLDIYQILIIFVTYTCVFTNIVKNLVQDLISFNKEHIICPFIILPRKIYYFVRISIYSLISKVITHIEITSKSKQSQCIVSGVVNQRLHLSYVRICRIRIYISVIFFNNSFKHLHLITFFVGNAVNFVYIGNG